MVAIDMNTTGNNTVTCAGQGCAPGTLGTVESCGEIATVGGTLVIDIVVNAVPSIVAGSGAGPNIQGYDMDLIFGTAGIVEVTVANGAASGGPPGNVSMMYAGTTAGSHSSFTELPPDSDGFPNDFFMGETDFGAIGESGPGILMRLTLHGLAVGSSTLTLQFTTGGSPFPAVYDNSGAQNPYTITSNQAGLIFVGGACPTATPSPSSTPSPTPTLSPTPSPTFTPTPTATPTATPSPTPTSTPSPTPTSTPSPTPTPGSSTVWADIDCGGAVAITDALKVSRWLINLSITQAAGCPPLASGVTVNGVPRVWGDIDCGGSVSITDALKIARWLINLPITQAAGCPPLGTLTSVASQQPGSGS